MESNYIIIVIVIVFILIMLFKNNTHNTNNYNHADDTINNLYDIKIERIKAESEADARVEIKENQHKNKKSINETNYKLNFYNSPNSPDTHLFLPIWNILQQEAPPNLQCNNINCSSRSANQSNQSNQSNKPLLILIINDNDEHNIPLTQDYNQLKQKLEAYDVDFDKKNKRLPNELVESFDTRQDLEKKIHEICHHDTFFTRMRDERNPGGYVHCIKNNPYVKGCTSVNPQLGLNNFNSAYNIIGGYIDTIPDPRKSVHKICAKKYQKNFKDLGVCLPGLLKEYADFKEGVDQKKYKNRLENGHHYNDNKHISDVIYNTCFS